MEIHNNLQRTENVIKVDDNEEVRRMKSILSTQYLD